ncbi:MAG: hypothetical protein QME60_05880 [Verrucomicrobiota bacterium]|nr:hypothetical protein [Verrucomicrobiota bacterium]
MPLPGINANEATATCLRRGGCGRQADLRVIEDLKKLGWKVGGAASRLMIRPDERKML